MKAIYFTGHGKASLADLPEPELKPGHVLIDVRASGLCHTDIDVLHGRYGSSASPLVPGHEYAGVVLAVAEDVANVRPGDRIAVDPNIPCGHCRACRKGLSNLCSNLKAYGVTHNGGFAEQSRVHVAHVHPIGDLSFDVAALAEPLACVLNGLDTAGLGTGSRCPENALVFGAGPIGLLMALSLKAQGVAQVSVADINEHRLAFVESLGLEPVMSGSDALEKAGAVSTSWPTLPVSRRSWRAWWILPRMAARFWCSASAHQMLELPSLRLKFFAARYALPVHIL